MFPFVPVIIQHQSSGEILLLAYLSKGEWQSLQKGKMLRFYFNDAEFKWMAEDNGTRPLTFTMSGYTQDISSGTLLIMAEPVIGKNASYLSAFSGLSTEISELYRLNRLVRYHVNARNNDVEEIKKRFSSGSLSAFEKKHEHIFSEISVNLTPAEISDTFIRHLIFLAKSGNDLLSMLSYIKKDLYEI